MEEDAGKDINQTRTGEDTYANYTRILLSWRTGALVMYTRSAADKDTDNQMADSGRANVDALLVAGVLFTMRGHWRTGWLIYGCACLSMVVPATTTSRGTLAA